MRVCKLHKTSVFQGKPLFWLPFLFMMGISSLVLSQEKISIHPPAAQDGWQEFQLIFIDTIMTVIDRGVNRVFGEIDGRRFILTTLRAEVGRGDNVFYMAPRDTTVFDIREYVDASGATLRLLPQGPENAEVEIFIADVFLPGISAIDQAIILKEPVAAIQVLPNYPNPFNTATTLRFTIPDQYIFGVPVTITIFNLRGQKVTTLLQEVLYPGAQQFRWTPGQGGPIASGLYVYRILLDKQSRFGKLMLLK